MGSSKPQTKKPSLAETHPELAAQADGWDPKHVSRGSHEIRLWRCNLDHKWNASPNNRTSHNTGCPFCVGKKAMVGFNDIATTHPDIALQADGWDPTKFVIRSKKKLLWKCEFAHSYVAAPQDRFRGRGCPFCGGRRVLTGFNDIATTHPELAKEAFGWNADLVSYGSSQKVQWRCRIGHVFETTPNARTGRKGSKSGCPYCSGNAVLVGFNDIATTHPEISRMCIETNPSEISFGSHKKVLWECDLGHTWRAIVKDVVSKSGCPTCANWGFDPNKPSFLYFLDHFDLQMLQIGITNDPNRRLLEHGKKGWEAIELRGPLDGHLTQQLETSCLRALEKRGAILGHKAGIEKFDGYSEAWTKKSLNVTSIKQILDWVYEDESADLHKKGEHLRVSRLISLLPPDLHA